ncbi:MAG: quinone-dependent dihydroorotate dehydrogenase [Candidatus Hydrogenedentota bacterium]|nr:MAG: quinone-dependent dihydroorotate dehydrogenase [Candidatus Hydrogenedentota bacterium]
METPVISLPTLQWAYQTFQKAFFLLDPEFAHKVAMESLEKLKPLLSVPVFPKETQVHVFDHRLAHPIGLAAGFDKEGNHAHLMSKLGFSYIEAGTFTPKKQVGNPKPRLFREVRQKSLRNKMGFNNPGISLGIDNLNQEANKIDKEKLPTKIAISIGKQKETKEEDAIRDYINCIQTIQEKANQNLKERILYIAINVSSPNTKGLRNLQEDKTLTELIQTLKSISTFPLVVKLAPDFPSDADFQNTVKTCKNADGIIVTNTTTQYQSKFGEGGVSGELLKDLAEKRLKQAKEVLPENFPIIASGGIMTPEDIDTRLQEGAILVQVFTGWIYSGPALILNWIKNYSQP